MGKAGGIIITVSCNGMREMTDERVKQAMGEHAIAFAQWILDGGFNPVLHNPSAMWGDRGALLTTMQLYERYNGQKD